MDAIRKPATESASGDSLRIEPPEPFSYAQTLGYMARSANECMYRIADGQVTRLIPCGEDHLLIRLRAEESALRVDFPEARTTVSDDMRETAARYVREWFDLDRDLSPFYELAAGDALLSRTVDRLHGLRIVGIHDLFEALCWGIMGQQINLAFAYTLKRRFVETFGRSVRHEEEDYWIFPEPAAIAGLSTAELMRLQLTGRKSEYLIGVAELVAGGELSRQRLLDIGDVGAIERELVRIRGIGPWTAHYVLMRCLRLPSAFPIGDVGLHNALKHMLELDAKPPIAEIARLAEGWQGWQGYATFYLWRMID